MPSQKDPQKALLKILYNRFFSKTDNYAIAVIDETVKYNPIPGKPAPSQILAHIRGETVLGAYNLLPDNLVSWGAFDVDSTKLSVAKVLAKQIVEILGNVPHSIEYSGRKGYHIFLWLDKLYPAAEVQRVLLGIRDSVGAPRAGDPHVEVYPKQASLSANLEVGNLIKVPLGKHPVSDNFSMFVDPEKDWENGPSLDPLEELAKTCTLEELKNCYEEGSPEERIAQIIARHRAPGQGHNMILSLAGFLASNDWTLEQTTDVVEEVMRLTGDDDYVNRIQAVEDTYKRYARGDAVVGLQGLSELLPQKVIQELVAIAGEITVESTVLVIDNIRLGESAAFLKVRQAAKFIHTRMQELGRIVFDGSYLLWLDRETHQLYQENTPGWTLFLHSRFGLNLKDSFSQQTEESLRLFMQDSAALVDVHRRSFWNGDKLYINLGGAEVYVLDGKNITIQMNGEGDVIFRNSEDTILISDVMSDKVKPMDPWSVLVDDLSFANNETSAASGDEQRELLKAWILSVFFAQTMPTRPILSLMGGAGSGKTTSARRVLRFFEGPDENVLGVLMDKPDALRTSLMQHKIVVLDNMEKTKAPWIPDLLNRVSTGATIEVRKLYTTSDLVRMKPDVFVIITAIDLPFSEESIYSRLLPLEMAQLVRPTPEYALQRRLSDNYSRIWKGMFRYLQEVISALKSSKVMDAPTSMRLADFSIFCSRISTCKAVKGDLLLKGLQAMAMSQQKALRENSPFVVALESWMSEHPDIASRPHQIGELNSILGARSQLRRVAWQWSSATGLARHVKMLEPQLIAHFGLVIEQVTVSSGRKANVYSFTKAKVTVE